MWSESVDEMFTYIGKAPEKTPEEEEEIKKLLKEAQEDWDRQMLRIKMGYKLDGTKYKPGENFPDENNENNEIQ
ncbi:hypothetical protein MmiAt1_12280 [Methanimicrococcus sp. At1]|uniref:Uncharacterized protein n=1 Tax=Methanimicrococcus hacksteinii TaxID=3028293 RepID=A0ABU3VQF8_9EURY|nr:hypothetical protein [Methanimicrococcus sp. At1]MDV0445639.1 hypothetical protein [Methanimicrococcus sp. At1]